MFASLVITLREGVEAALIVGIVAGYLRKSGRGALIRFVYWALAAAVAASCVAGYFVSLLRVNEDAYEGWLMLVGAVFVASVVIWMYMTAKHMRREIEEKLAGLTGRAGGSAAWGVFFFVFLMVFREGIETVLFLAAVSLDTTALMNFIGGVIGLALAVGLGIAFFKGSIKVNLRKFFSVTTIVLLVVALQLLVSGIHELSEAMVLPSSREEMHLVGPIVNNDTFFFVVIIALCLFLVLAQKFQAAGRSEAELQTLPAPERRKAVAEQRRDVFWKTAVSAVGLLVIVLIGAEFIYSRVAQAVTPPEPVKLVEGGATIPFAELQDHKLHHYVVEVHGAGVHMIAIEDDSGVAHVALDACHICGTQGYYQEGRNVICRNCSSSIYIPTIGMKGGCNPIPIAFNYQKGAASITVPESALEAAARVFRGQ
ncbi:MAG: Fe-S-containing protein [Terriglobia bacterium]